MIFLVTATFNREISNSLERSAIEVLSQAGEEFELFHVPGALELPITAQRLIRDRRPDVVLALACVVRGTTDRYDLVVRCTTDGLSRVALDESTPVVIGLLACPDVTIARERKNCGAQYAEIARDMKAFLPQKR